MELDLEAHAEKLRAQRNAEAQAQIDRETKLQEIAKSIKKRAFEYALEQNQLSSATTQNNVVSLVYRHSNTMIIEVQAANAFYVIVKSTFDDDDIPMFDRGEVVDKEGLMTKIVDFVDGRI